ncbi:MAG: RusA family crossover junction endodeoxyribonuclease [Clostridia bacterium]|nr:RusA family crossover junction endodeoxyribonuclease [Clostridia bacterium]
MEIHFFMPMIPPTVTQQQHRVTVQKGLKDIMTKLHFWKDDALVASEVVEKFWSDVPGIWIGIREIGQ